MYGHEFLEFEFRPDGRLRYANNSNYKSDILIRKEGIFNFTHQKWYIVYLSDTVLEELKRIIKESEILK